ncbi:MAG: hypothetical protein ABI080_11280 [Candidatus Binatia bacterium]
MTGILKHLYIHAAAFAATNQHRPASRADGDDMRRLMTMGVALVLMLSGAMTTYADVGLREPSSIGSQVI